MTKREILDKANIYNVEMCKIDQSKNVCASIELDIFKDYAGFLCRIYGEIYSSMFGDKRFCSLSPEELDAEYDVAGLENKIDNMRRIVEDATKLKLEVDARAESKRAVNKISMRIPE